MKFYGAVIMGLILGHLGIILGMVLGYLIMDVIVETIK